MRRPSALWSSCEAWRRRRRSSWSSTTWSSCSDWARPSPCCMRAGFSPRADSRKYAAMRGCWMSTSEGPSVLRVADLRAGYGSTPVLVGVNLEVGEGEVVAVLGRNGMGKTTLLRTLMGLLPARSGSIRWKDEQEISKLATHLRARLGLGYVPQGRDIFPGLTVLENLRLGGMASGRDGSKRLQDVLELFPMLSEKLTARGATLSGGQQQLLALARALVSGPKILLLDEPSEGIQPSILEQIVDSIRMINREEGIAVLLVEQNLQFAAALAGRAYIMNKGVVVRELPIARIVEDPEIQREYMGV